MESGAITRLTNTSTAEEWPTWHPQGDKLAFIIDDFGDREVFTLDVAEPPNEGGAVEPVTWLGRTDGQVWSPAGDRLAAVFHRWDGEIIAIQTPGGDYQLPHLLTEPIAVQGRLTWHAETVNLVRKLPRWLIPELRLSMRNNYFLMITPTLNPMIWCA